MNTLKVDSLESPARTHSFSDNLDPLLKRRQAAQYLNVHPGTLANWGANKQRSLYRDLPIVRVGRSCYYRKSTLDAFIAKRTTTIPHDAD